VAVYEFPALGFDPAPGDAGTVEEIQRDVREHSRLLGEAGQTLGRLRAASWVGRASDAFHGEVERLPSDLDTAAHAYAEVVAALLTYAAELEAARSEAIRLEEQAARARQALDAVLGQVHLLSMAPAGEADGARADRLQQLRDVRARADTVGSDHQAILGRARALEDHMNGVAENAAQRILGAAETPPYHHPGWLQSGWDSVASFVRDHADLLRQISSVLKIVSGIAGLLSFIPGVGAFFAIVAVATAVAALVIDVLLKLSTGQGSWASIGIDAALVALPGGGKLFRAALEARSAARVAEEQRALMNSLMHGLGRGQQFGGNWKPVSLRDTVRTIAGDAPVVAKGGAKTVYRNPKTGLQVVYDVGGNYFRVQNRAQSGSIGEYLDETGNIIPANLPVLRAGGGYTLQGVPRSVRQGLTHFMNTDTLTRFFDSDPLGL
jgi:uncharacterized protein YukE